MRWLLLALAACATPQVTAQASAAIQGAAGEQADTQSASQAVSAAGVKVKTGARHIGVSVVPSLDGGAPTFKLDVDDAPDEIMAGAQGEADGGSGAAVDAGVGIAGQGAGQGAASAPSFWTVRKLLVLAGLAALAVALYLARGPLGVVLSFARRFIG